MIWKKVLSLFYDNFDKFFDILLCQVTEQTWTFTLQCCRRMNEECCIHSSLQFGITCCWNVWKWGHDTILECSVGIITRLSVLWLWRWCHQESDLLSICIVRDECRDEWENINDWLSDTSSHAVWLCCWLLRRRWRLIDQNFYKTHQTVLIKQLYYVTSGQRDVFWFLN